MSHVRDNKGCCQSGTHSSSPWPMTWLLYGYYCWHDLMYLFRCFKWTLSLSYQLSASNKTPLSLTFFLLSWGLHQTKSFKSKDLVLQQYILYYSLKVCLLYPATHIFCSQKNHLESECCCIFTWKSTRVIPCLHKGWFPQQHYSSEPWAPWSSGVWLPG